MLERRAARPNAAPPGPSVPVVPAGDEQDVPAGTLVPVQSPPAGPFPSGEPSPARPAAALLDFACRVAAEHEQAHGEPITRDKLRVRLGVSNQLASDLLREIRAS